MKLEIQLENLIYVPDCGFADHWFHNEPGYCCGARVIAVGLPVTQQPPHRSRRADFSHRALQKYSLPHGLQAIMGAALIVL
jgi:hypothetical protein